MYKFLLQTIRDGSSLPTQLYTGLHEGDTRRGGEGGGGDSNMKMPDVCWVSEN